MSTESDAEPVEVTASPADVKSAVEGYEQCAAELSPDGSAYAVLWLDGSASVGDIGAALEAQGGLIDYQYRDQDAVYEDFLQWASEDPEVEVDPSYVKPEDFQASFEVWFTTQALADVSTPLLTRLPGVEDMVLPSFSEVCSGALSDLQQACENGPMATVPESIEVYFLEIRSVGDDTDRLEAVTAILDDSLAVDSYEYTGHERVLRELDVRNDIDPEIRELVAESGLVTWLTVDLVDGTGLNQLGEIVYSARAVGSDVEVRLPFNPAGALCFELRHVWDNSQAPELKPAPGS